jgi:hypothetical protein
MRLDADDETATLVDDETTEGRPSDVDSKAPTAVDDSDRPVSHTADEEGRIRAQGADES